MKKKSVIQKENIQAYLSKFIYDTINNNFKNISISKKFKDLNSLLYIHFFTKCATDNEFINFIKDLKNKKLKKEYIFDNLYSKKICEISDLNPKFYYKKNINNLFEIFQSNELLKVFYFFFLKIITFSFANKKNRGDVMCLVLVPEYVEYIKKIAKNTNLKFVVFNDFHRVKLKLRKNEVCYAPLNINFSNINFSIFSNFKFRHNIINLVLDFYNPKVWLSIEGGELYNEIASQLSKSKKIKSVCLQWGSMGAKDIPTAKRGMSFDYFISWGQFYSQKFKKFNKKISFKNLGNPYVRSNINKKKIIVLIMQPINNFFSPQKSEILELIKLSTWLTIKYPNWKVIIREHPRMTVTEIEKINKIGNKVSICNYNESISKLYKNSYLVIGSTSSSLIEASASNCSVISFINDSKDTYFPDLKKNNMGYCITNDVLLKKKVSDIIDKYNYKNNRNYKFKKFSKTFFNFTGDIARKKINKFIKELV